jgi:thioredoxin reductase
MFDVIIIGAGPAGLSAALILGRFRRSVLILDGQQPRNARSQGVHGFLSRDGILPHELLHIGRAQLEAYSTVQVRAQQAVDITPSEAGFDVHLQDGTREAGRKILFATGVRDLLPPIEGMDALWGRGVFHCPYCHGWEARDKAIAILGNGEGAVHFAKLLHALSDDLVICTNGKSEIEVEDRDCLERSGIRVVETPIAQLRHTDGRLEALVFEDGTALQREAVFIRAAQEQHSSLPAALGCAINQHGYIQVDADGRTSIPGVYAAGDLTSGKHQVIYAAAGGAAAAAMMNAELADEAFMRL